MVLESGVKQRVGWIKKRTGRSYCDFLMFVHQRTREDNGHQCGKRFLIRIHKSVRWPCTYDNTDFLWRVRLSVRTRDFHSLKRSSILLPATNKKLKWKKSNIPYSYRNIWIEFVRKYFETDASYCTDFNFFRKLRGSETDRNS